MDRDELVEMFEKEAPEVRMVAFGLALGKQVAQLPTEIAQALEKEFASVATSLLHTAVNFPDWAKAVVEDSEYFKELGCDDCEDTYEEALEYVMNLYPLDTAVYTWPPASRKSKNMQEVASRILGREDNVYDKADCVFCDKVDLKPDDFRDSLSRKEFGLSRMCQECQDSTFG